MEERDSINLGEEKIAVIFSKYFFPTLLGMLSMAMVAAADGVFVGRGVGSNGIAAVNICIPLYMIFTGIGLMTGVGCSVVASIHIARGKNKVARLNVTQAFLFTTIITLIATIFILLFSEQTALLLGSSMTLLPMVEDYLHWFIPGLIFQMWLTVGLFVIRLDGAPNMAMSCSLACAIANVILDYIFIFPLNWGVMGAAFASTISMVIGGLMTLFYLMFKAKKVKLLLPKWSVKSLQLSIRNIGYQIKVGSSALLGECTLAMLMLMGNYTFMRCLGDDGVGAFGIACYYIPFVFMVGNAIAQSAQPIISYNYGAKKMKRVLAIRNLTLITAFICGLISTVAFTLFPEFLTSLFLDINTSAGKISINGLPLFAMGFIFFIFNLSMVGYYQSMEKIMPATFFAFCRGLIFLVPSFIILPRVIDTDGIWLAMPMSEFLTTIFIVCFELINKFSRKNALLVD